MWKISYVVILCLLSSMIIDEIVCVRAPKKPKVPKKPGHRVPKTPVQKVNKPPQPPGTTVKKVQRLETLCHLLNYGELSGLKSHTLNKANDPIKKYQTGYHDRIEYVHAIITPQNLDKGSKTDGGSVKYVRSIGKPDDQAGHIIANRLGGSGTEHYNLFPQSPNINMGAWRTQEGTVYKLVKDNNQQAEVIIQFNYESPTATRPNRFRFRATGNNGCLTADVINP